MSTIPLPTEILRAWQRIEFFQPYKLDKKEKSLLISLDKLIKHGDKLLPWHSEELRQQYEIPPKVSFTVHIGIFENNIADAISSQIFGQSDTNEAEECEQRLNHEGATCFAKVQLNAEGAPAIQKLSVSSLPWALGHLQKQRFEKLHSAVFEADCQYLADELENFGATLKPVRENGPGVLHASDILTLLTTHLVSWADFTPDWQYALQIDWFESNGNDLQAAQADDNDAEEELSESEKSLALPILNSFFFEDIENAIIALQNHPSNTLNAYLSQGATRKPDLYSQAGMPALIEKLHPVNMPLGRWPSEPEHPMSLMQQFAINTAIDELSEGGILSVNGPPGTGKTTLLRDLIAHNIVERATVLSAFNKVDDTLDSDGFIVPSLTGFEMIVASSNNAAVENISKELPQLKSLAKEFRLLDYLAPVANQIAAKARPKSEIKRGKNGEGKERNYHLFSPLNEDKQCWGLISAALGKKDNRKKFAQRLCMDEHFLRKTPAETSRSDDENFLSLWRWRACHDPITFSAAKQCFVECLKQTQDLQNQLVTYADLLAKKPDNVANLQEKLKKAQALHDELTEKLKQAELEKEIGEKQVQHVTQQQKMVESEAPGFFSRLFDRQKVHAHQQALREVQQHLLTLTAQMTQKTQAVASQRKQCTEAALTIKTIGQEIDGVVKQQQLNKQRLAALEKQFPEITLPDRERPIDDPDLQRTAFWQNAQINRQRSRLFMAAMDLHQAWLYEAMGIGRFGKKLRQLSDFMSNPHAEAAPLRQWQTLSMFVPVLSTTFASVGRMLSGVKGEEIGWLMIDEAGQASPQQAVGAIWRAKRVLIVGDPLQIEPVFTTSPPLVKRLCEDVLQEHAEDWNPGLLSVQQVADRNNHWGCELEVMNIPIWIGIPLWVHRRCIEPMFSLANKMAYNSRMIHGFNTDEIVSRSVNNVIENHWLVSKGGVGEKQYRESHGQDLLTLLDRLLAEQVELQSIYIITPFKAVKSALAEQLAYRSLKVWQQYSPQLKRKDINEWQKNCVGTVHTFQGKENDIVIFVLGCDEQDNGGAKWASSKPNLLNVALTRAKKHIFVIGDPAVWQTLPGFESVAKVLPEKRAADMITTPENTDLMF
ncbi:helicase [Superficieibacter electus]|uniref:Helicase n=1 Tax=Superficieibacter electus TaxID=2022662 RepID=A0A2P5GQG6_9ENTR|nr:ATP-binding protein [Superficieibacter electus]POP45629.1 helicase [Superficieibacter electus]POP48790.1 helicase [Superficieibacter electus]